MAQVPVGYQAAGSHMAIWTGATQAGTKAPAGRYLLVMHCMGDDGNQATRALTAQLQR